MDAKRLYLGTGVIVQSKPKNINIDYINSKIKLGFNDDACGKKNLLNDKYYF